MIAVTKHAIKRIRERLPKNFEDYKWLATNAFNSKDTLPKWFLDSPGNLIPLGFRTYSYRFYKNKVFVFQHKDSGDIVLLTVYDRKLYW